MNIFKPRLDKLFIKIKELGVDGFYITNLTNIRYLTGFSGSAASVLITNQDIHFFSDGRYIVQANEQVKNCNIHITQQLHLVNIKDKKLLASKKINIAFEADHVSFTLYTQMKKIYPNVHWINTNNLIEEIASVKDSEELESLKIAISITDDVFDAILPEIKEGVTEKYISSKISYLFKQYGADGDSYESIIASGDRGALPHARPSEKNFNRGDFIVMDFGALYNGYHADMTRTVLIGPETEKHKQIYNIVLEAQLNGIQTAKANVKCASVDIACREIIEKHGYGDFFTHSTGHGIGLEVHTLPRIHKTNDDLLQTNQVITIEPGIYISGWGGVRIEDDCLIKDTQCIPLNRTTKELLVI